MGLQLKQGSQRTFFFFHFFKVHLFRIASVALSTGLQRTGFTLSTRITPIVC